MDQARGLLDRVPALQRPCDLDLLLFLARHPRTLMTGDQLARLLGYSRDEVGRAMDVLVGAGLITRSESPNRAAAMHVVATATAHDEWLDACLAFASTRDGRLTLRRTLAVSPPERAPGPPRPFLVRREPPDIPEPQSDAQQEETT
jgi:DNA-binding transcriptional ArsR family regulator